MALDAGSTAFIIVSMALVNLMTPGLAFFYGGLVRQQNVLTIMFQNYVSMGLITIVWVMWGFSLCFGKSGSFLGSPESFYFMENVNGAPLQSQAKDAAVGDAFVDGIPGLVFAGEVLSFFPLSSVQRTFDNNELFAPLGAENAFF